LREFVLGTKAERLIRLCRVPVLVVKRPPQGAYRRVLVPVELGPAARTVIAAATRLSRDPRMEVLHALRPGDELGMRAWELPEKVVRRERLRAADRARSRLQALIVEAAPRPDAAVVAVAFGDAASAGAGAGTGDAGGPGGDRKAPAGAAGRLPCWGA
jgi:nucleotide-binding universal stress UspA family protein